ncbi:Predicted transcriptional regulator [Paenibacillus sp. UNCCL117]|uniref:BlaI/MecI/CopY family transcriptional regulator n=1 Tax=unclassified Paenibacillus TaxID=185978 RepID=UPI00087F0768|nr:MULTISPECIES: BlaI/MecI/CopY family transcriptional regulator [unclassified Paenibacillus]SDD18913.1 Predicted transcriptional regulator [Paenibacillus sp. cl123]SFW35354.1 Predicted transcriptional regulator [Paenibacillus sp. UNCCL117]
MKIQNFKFYEKGLNRFFGPLEAKVLDILWDRPGQSIKEVQQKLERQEETLNFNTVMTVMNRLVSKGLLRKRQEGRASVYEPFDTKEHFLEMQSKEITHELLEDFGPLVVSHMLDALEEADAEMIEKLEQKIKELKRET